MRIRAAQPADVPAIVRLVNRAYRGESGRRSWTGEAHLLEGQRVDEGLVGELLERPSSVVLLVEEEALLGCVHVERKGHDAYLGMLTVEIDRQRSGLGRRLVAEAEQQARSWGCEAVEMTVISVRTELIEWYARRGYALTGERRPFPYGDERFGVPLRPDLEFVVLRRIL